MNALRAGMAWIGGGALLLATAVDTVSVAGRQLGFALHGAIEIIQAAILVAGSLALIASAAAGNHARVRLVVERAGAWRPWFERLGELMAIVFFGIVLVGSGWLALDLWSRHEVSELVGIPWRWLRLVTNIALVVLIAIAVRELVWGRRP